MKLIGNCDECVYENIYPPCVTFYKYKKITLDNICINKVSRNNSQRELSFVCPNNSLDIIDGYTVKLESCLNCNLCDYICSLHNNKSSFNLGLDLDFIIRNLTSIETLFFYQTKYLDKNKFYFEVAGHGNYRNKRIDCVEVTENSIILYKVIDDINKIDYYMRSYDDLISSYVKIYNNIRFYKGIIVRDLDALGIQINDKNLKVINLSQNI